MPETRWLIAIFAPGALLSGSLALLKLAGVLEVGWSRVLLPSYAAPVVCVGIAGGYAAWLLVEFLRRRP